ncbi:MAG: cupin domain-containing protein, partial [Alphaproteobacteria bacterium]
MRETGGHVQPCFPDHRRRLVLNDGRTLICQLELEPHPEGGWYRETWREGTEGRGHATAIYFLLEAGQRSHWHRVDAAEMWLFQAGTPITLS